jgi:hypothetical protein
MIYYRLLIILSPSFLRIDSGKNLVCNLVSQHYALYSLDVPALCTHVGIARLFCAEPIVQVDLDSSQ